MNSISMSSVFRSFEKTATQLLFRSSNRNFFPRHCSTQSNLTEDEQSQVVNFINTSDDEALKDHMSASLYKAIVKLKCEGEINTIDDIIKFAGVRKDSFNRFCQTLLCRNIETRKRTNFFTPTLRPAEICSIENVVSIEITPVDFAFAKMDSTRTVVEWGYSQHDVSTRHRLDDYYRVARAAYGEIARGDLYMFENSFIRQSRLHMKKVILQSMLFAMINQSYENDSTQQTRCVVIRPSRFVVTYSLKVGSERKSCANVFEQYVADERIILPTHLQLDYKQSTPVRKELTSLMSLMCLLYWNEYPKTRKNICRIA